MIEHPDLGDFKGWDDLYDVITGGYRQNGYHFGWLYSRFEHNIRTPKGMSDFALPKVYIDLSKNLKFHWFKGQQEFVMIFYPDGGRSEIKWIYRDNELKKEEQGFSTEREFTLEFYATIKPFLL